MLVARGTAVRFVLEDGRSVRGAKGAALLQDETGRALPRNVAIVMPFRRTGRHLEEPPPEARRHLGRGFAPLEGRVVLPSLSSGWKRIGKVREVYYSRRGEHAGQYEHAFVARWLSGLPVLYARARALKLDLARGSSWDWRGVHG